MQTEFPTIQPGNSAKVDDIDGVLEENARLREVIESYRRRELDELRQKVGELQRLVDHYQAEAQRNADVGRQIAAESQVTIAELRARLAVLEQVKTSNVRNARTT